MNYMEAREQVIKLHDIARLIEEDFGDCDLSQNLRKSADLLSDLCNDRIIHLYASNL